MSEPFQIDIDVLAGRLTTLERGLLIGAFKEWGSWMREVGSLCALGLMKRDGPNIVHTEMGRVIADRILAEHKAESESDDDIALRKATALAVALHRKHYPEVTHWEPLPDLCGVISQIDNMVAGLVRPERSET